MLMSFLHRRPSRRQFERTTTSNASIGLPTTSFLINCKFVSSIDLMRSSTVSVLLPINVLPFAALLLEQSQPEAPRQRSALRISIISPISSSNYFPISSPSLQSSILTTILIQAENPHDARSVLVRPLALRQRYHRRHRTCSSAINNHRLITSSINRPRNILPLGEWNYPIFYLAQNPQTHKFSFTTLLLLTHTLTRPGTP